MIDLREATSDTCGAKAGSLGRLARAGAPVPAGFVIPFAVYRAAVHGRPDFRVPAALRRELTARLAALGDPPVAVRSSASTEDTATASAAGQHDSFLGVRGAEFVTDRVRACWASLRSARAVAYRRAHDLSPDPAMAVIVQRHIDADAAGVLFTGDPDAAAPSLIEASWGLGESVVHGLVTPDSWTVAPTGVARHTTGDKHTRVDRGPAGTVTRAVPAVDRRRPCLNDADVIRLATVGRDMARVFGIPLDIEWALAGGEIWLLQARPITAALPADAVPADAVPADAVPGIAGVGGSGVALAGVPGSPGRAAGPARLVTGSGDFGRVRPGDVVVCRTTDPAWTPLFTVAAAVVTETGGVLSHAAIVAREQRIPAVLGAPGAMAILRDGQTVVVDGDTGTVHRDRRI